MSPCSVQGDPDLRHPKNPPGIHLPVPAPGDTQRQQGGDEAQKCPLKPQGSRSQEEPPPSPSLPLSGMQRHPPGWMDGWREGAVLLPARLSPLLADPGRGMEPPLADGEGSQHRWP